MKVVFHGTLIHHLKDLFLAKAKTPWEVERFFEQDPPGDFARAMLDADVLISLAWNAQFPPAPARTRLSRPSPVVAQGGVGLQPPFHGHREGDVCPESGRGQL